MYLHKNSITPEPGMKREDETMQIMIIGQTGKGIPESARKPLNSAKRVRVLEICKSNLAAAKTLLNKTAGLRWHPHKTHLFSVEPAGI